MQEKRVLDISKAIDAASGFAQGIEAQDLEGKTAKTNTLTEEEDEDEDDDGQPG
ncbi:MAG: hypothetical protein WC965_02125 [Thiohalomonadaceae bacterium]